MAEQRDRGVKYKFDGSSFKVQGSNAKPKRLLSIFQQEHVSTSNNNNDDEFGRDTNRLQLFSTVGPFDVIYDPEGGTTSYGGGGTGRTNQAESVSTSSNHPNMNFSDYSKKNQRSTNNDGGIRTGTQDDNISTISQRSIIAGAKANETPIVVNERKGGGTGNINQLSSVSTSSNNAKMNYSDDSNKTRGLTVDEGGNRTQHENISTVFSDRSTIASARADEPPNVVDKGKDVKKGLPRRGLKKWLCLGWLANKR